MREYRDVKYKHIKNDLYVAYLEVDQSLVKKYYITELALIKGIDEELRSKIPQPPEDELDLEFESELDTKHAEFKVDYNKDSDYLKIRLISDDGYAGVVTLRKSEPITMRSKVNRAKRGLLLDYKNSRRYENEETT